MLITRRMKKKVSLFLAAIMISSVCFIGVQAIPFKGNRGTVVYAYPTIPYAFPGYNMSYAPYYYDENVKAVQHQLNNQGDDLQPECTVGEEDGFFGPKTLAAVKYYQSFWGLQVDGIVGRNTWNMLMYNTTNP